MMLSQHSTPILSFGIIFRHLMLRAFGSVFLLTLILLMIAWMTQSIRFLDFLANHQASFLKFFQIVLFLIPSLAIVILPPCCLVGSLSSLQKLANDDELLIYQSIGISPLQLAKPFLIVGVLMGLVVGGIAHGLAGQTFDQFTSLKSTLGKEFSAGLLRAGTFSQFKEITVYIERRTPSDELTNVFISQQQDPETQVCLFAQKGHLILQNNQYYLQLFQGSRHTYGPGGHHSFLFDELVYDMDISPPSPQNFSSTKETNLRSFLWPSPSLPEEERHHRISEGHKRILSGYLPFFFMLYGASFVLFSSSRGTKGHSRRSLYMIAGGIGLQMFIYSLLNLVRHSFLFIGLAYLVPLGLSLFFYFSLKKGSFLFFTQKKEK